MSELDKVVTPTTEPTTPTPDSNPAPPAVESQRDELNPRNKELVDALLDKPEPTPVVGTVTQLTPPTTPTSTPTPSPTTPPTSSGATPVTTPPSEPPPAIDPKVIAAQVLQSIQLALPRPEPAKPAAPPAPVWKPFQVDKKFVDSIIEDSEKGAQSINALVEGTIRSTLELVVPYMQQLVQPLTVDMNAINVERAKSTFKQKFPDLSSENDLEWAQEVGMNLVKDPRAKDMTMDQFLEEVAKSTRSLKDEYRKRLNLPAPQTIVTPTSNPAAPTTAPGTAPSGGAPRPGTVSTSRQAELMNAVLKA